MVTHRTSQVETLFGVLEELDPKMEALGIIQADGITIYSFDA